MTGTSREVAFRYDVIRQGVVWGTAESLGGCTVSLDTARKIQRIFSGGLLLPEGMRRLHDRLRPVMILEGKEYPLGEFLLTTVEKRREGKQIFYYCEGYDPSVFVFRTRLEEKLFLPAGQAYSDILSALLVRCGVDKVIMEPVEYVLATDREDWEVGTPVLDVINDLLDEIGYRPLYFDAAGQARIRPYQAVQAKNIDHTYGPGQPMGYGLVQENYVQEDDLFESYNVFLVQCENPDIKEMMQAVSVNDDPDSALSTMQIGRVMAPPVKVKNIPNQKALQQYADNLKWKAMTATETTVIKTALNPVHESGEVVALEGDLSPGIYEESGWVMKLLPGGVMQHTLRRAMYL